MSQFCRALALVWTAACIGSASARGEDPPRTHALDTGAGFSLRPDPVETSPVPPESETPFFIELKVTVEFGLDGSSGNTEGLNLRGGISLHRTTDSNDTKAWANYAYATADGEANQSRGAIGARNDWLLSPSPWLYFADALLEYDEFESWNWRVSGHGGFGYEFVKDEDTSLVGRAGAGFNQTLGGDDPLFTPEGLLGLGITHALSKRQTISASIDYFPSFLDIADYRVVARAGWDIVVDPETRMSLKIGARDEYDSRPGGTASNNNLDYFALLAWGF